MIYRQFLGMWSKIRETLGNSSKFMGGKLRASCVSCFFFALQPSSLPFDGHQKCLDPIQNHTKPLRFMGKVWGKGIANLLRHPQSSHVP